MWNESEGVDEVLVYDPKFIDPKLPTGFWFCADPADVLAVQINAGCLRASGGWERLGRHEAFFLQFCYVLVVCADPAKREVMVRELRSRLPNVILLAVEDKDFRACPSVRELRDTYGLKAVDQMLLEAVEIPAYGLLDLADVKQPDVTRLDKVLYGIPNLDRATGGAIMGELSVWTGKRGEGKSTLLDQFLLEAIDQGLPVCAYSGELSAWKFKYWASLQAAGPQNLRLTEDKLSGRRVAAPTPFAQELIDQWWKGRFLLYDIGTSTYHDAANILRVFRYAHRRYGAKVYLVDNLMTARFRGNDRDFYRAQSEFVAELASFAHDNQVHVHLVAHPRKTDQIDDADDVAGIGDVTNLADNVYALEKESRPERQQDCVLTILKNRFFGERGRSIGLNFEPQSKRFYKSGTGNPNKAYGWALSGPQMFLELTQPDPDDPFAPRGGADGQSQGDRAAASGDPAPGGHGHGEHPAGGAPAGGPGPDPGGGGPGGGGRP